MITDAIIAFISTAVRGFLDFLPDWGANGLQGFDRLVSMVEQTQAFLGAYFPVGTLGTCLAVVFGAQFLLGRWKTIVWLWEKIPFN